MELVEGQGKYGVMILYERRMEIKEEEASETEEGLEEPKDVEVLWSRGQLIGLDEQYV